jgi:hypothetical protein
VKVLWIVIMARCLSNPQLWTWLAGYHDAHRTLRHPEVPIRPINHVGVFSFDLAADRRE